MSMKYETALMGPVYYSRHRHLETADKPLARGPLEKNERFPELSFSLTLSLFLFLARSLSSSLDRA